MNDSREFSRYRIELLWKFSLTFPVNEQSFQDHVLCSARDRRLSLDTWNLFWITGETFFGNPRPVFASSQTSYQRILHFTTASATGCGSSARMYRDTCRKRWRTNLGARTTVPMSWMKAVKPWNAFFASGNSTEFFWLGSKRQQISELQFDKFPAPSSFSGWKIRFRQPGDNLFWLSIGCYVMDQRSGDGRFSGWIKILAINCRSRSSRLSHFKKEGQSRGPESQERGPIYTRKTDRLEDLRLFSSCWALTIPFLITLILFSITLRNDNVQEFDTIWYEILLSMTGIPPDDILESLYKSRIRESDQLKNCIGIVRHGNSAENIDAQLSEIEDIDQKLPLRKFRRPKRENWLTPKSKWKIDEFLWPISTIWNVLEQFERPYQKNSSVMDSSRNRKHMSWSWMRCTLNQSLEPLRWWISVKLCTTDWATKHSRGTQFAHCVLLERCPGWNADTLVNFLVDVVSKSFLERLLSLLKGHSTSTSGKRVSGCFPDVQESLLQFGVEWMSLLALTTSESMLHRAISPTVCGVAWITPEEHSLRFVTAGGNVACLSSCVARTIRRWWIGDRDKGVHAHLLVLSVRTTWIAFSPSCFQSDDKRGAWLKILSIWSFQPLSHAKVSLHCCHIWTPRYSRTPRSRTSTESIGQWCTWVWSTQTVLESYDMETQQKMSIPQLSEIEDIDQKLRLQKFRRRKRGKRAYTQVTMEEWWISWPMSTIWNMLEQFEGREAECVELWTSLWNHFDDGFQSSCVRQIERRNIREEPNLHIMFY